MLSALNREEILEVLSEGGFCKHCQYLLKNHVHNLLNRKMSDLSLSNGTSEGSTTQLCYEDASASRSAGNQSDQQEITSSISVQTPESTPTHKAYTNNSSRQSINMIQHSAVYLDMNLLLNDGLSEASSLVSNGLTEEQKERIRFSHVNQKKDFVHIERVNGRAINVLQGLELHTCVFNAEEQKKIVECVYEFQRMGRNGQLRGRTYSEPRKWMRGKGRVTIQFGCCYNYAVDRNGNPPGINRDEEVDPFPPLFKKMIERLVRWHVLPPSCVPDSCIVNLYDEGDCIPPHIDHHDFLRPFCTVSFLTECNILFGSKLKILSPGEFSGPVSIPLPVGSVLVLNGNGADAAKHCVPGVPAKRISITFRKMDKRKLPYSISSDTELIGVKPLLNVPVAKSPNQQKQQHHKPIGYAVIAKSQKQQTKHQNGMSAADEYQTPNTTSTSPSPFLMEKNDFPPLGSLTFYGNRSRPMQ